MSITMILRAKMDIVPVIPEVRDFETLQKELSFWLGEELKEEDLQFIQVRMYDNQYEDWSENFKSEQLEEIMGECDISFPRYLPLRLLGNLRNGGLLSFKNRYDVVFGFTAGNNFRKTLLDTLSGE